MKKTKIIVPAVVLVVVFLIGMFVGIPIGRGSSNGENGNGSEYGGFEYEEPQTVTLKEYLDGGPRAFIYGSTKVDKDSRPIKMFLFENGQVYYIYNQSHERNNLTWGEISKMTDEELADYVRNNGENMGEYQLHIYTDSTGNNLEYEGIYCGDNREMTLYPYTNTAIVYDSVFKGFSSTDDGGQASHYRVNDDITVTLDNIGDEGVEVD